MLKNTCYAILLSCVSWSALQAQQSDVQRDEAIVKQVADYVLDTAEFAFVDKEGNTYPDTADTACF